MISLLSFVTFIIHLVAAMALSGGATQMTLHSFTSLMQQERSKRQLLDTAARCVARCAQDMSQKMGNQFGNIQAGIGTLNSDMFDKELLTQFCSAYKDGSECFELCQNSVLKRTLQSGFAALDFICVQGHDELQENVVCYQQSQPQVNATCVPECGGPEVMQKYQREQEEAKQKDDLEAIASVMGKMCDYVDCHLSCEVPIRIQTCHSRAAGDWMQKFVSVALKGAKDMLLNVGASAFFPESCNRLAEGRFTSPNGEDLQYPQNDGQMTRDTSSKSESYYSQNVKSAASNTFISSLFSLLVLVVLLNNY